MSIYNLEYFFNPRRIAVIGADDKPGSIGYTVFRNLIGEGYRGIVYPVNPRTDSVQGVEAYKNLSDISKEIDLVVLAEECGSDVLTVLEECGQKAVKGVILLCPDFRTKVREAIHLEEEIEKIHRKYGFRLLGPNTLGFIRPGINLNVSLFRRRLNKGNIALIAQSATLSVALLDRASDKNIGFSYFVSLGSDIDIDFADLIDFFGVDPSTRAIVIYMQSIKNGRKFMTSARSFAFSKPIVIVKSGKFVESLEVALTHSGLLAGEDKVYDAAFKRAGAVRVDETLDMFYITETLSKQRRPRGKRLAIITNAGAPAVTAVDSLLKLGGELAEFSEETLRELEGNVPTRFIRNPLDLVSDAKPDYYEKALSVIIKDKNVDAVLVMLTPSLGADPAITAQRVIKIAKENPYKPVLTNWMGATLVEEARELLNSNGIPTFVTPEQAVRSFMYMYRYDFNLKLLLETPQTILKDVKFDTEKVQTIIEKAISEGRSIPTFFEASEILSAYGIPVILTKRANTIEELKKAIAEIGYPVVLKIDTPKIIHKFKKGGVILDVRDELEAVEGFKWLKKLATEHGDPEASIIVQPMVITYGYEIALGAKKDPTFGSVILFGTGGNLLEALEDYSIGLPPLNQTLAKRLMEETKIYRYLSKYPYYEDILRRLEETVVKFSYLISDFPQIKEFDINPVFITDSEIFALDCSIIFDKTAPKKKAVIKGEFCPPHLSICPYPIHLYKEMELKDGTKAIVRPIKAEDEALIADLLGRCSERTISLRFFQRAIDLRHENLVKFCQVDYDRELAFICVIKDGDEEKIVGDVRLSKDPDGLDAEMAILVEDAWQGKGVGKVLCSYAIEVAKDLGVKRIWMDILRINTYMLGLSERLGFKKHHVEEDSIKVLLNLDNTS
ncbi:MAG: bifunctional acetate--CoA ligase family protein/GNAT family N-acetyltransferase [Thermodesulfovibrio sp.]|uniref:bifunctional acetate--CoA ligase family protein/GNAT family N-acetyltransferase n=1 Tax=unclassified Thermodesulfovibrio TaxID=2645936 RepID=UPI00083B84DE|nr:MULTISPECIES: bifunctional acetate--CoA ligase family protein/GNAT family N-acetyltransferase [unclassified Thermodesulfovibrio]MDI1472149.1 bifunctional acetate--CoA ligase family protein/GNAT family N-acetyltransferase [Thermodesulfovibrio sp. 1176]MDI6715242.1 bifunctional acetate--CoA ligase family protein/GNAT family N-acetyltransferase [Thermodesulfovibrio sp.]ODA45101.1 putative Acetyl-CoA synthetase (ADP-forming) alpha and beta chains [Thermodesulfovibrio sp. N1]